MYRLKLILRIIEKDRRMRSFTDIIGFALGSTGERIVTCLFFMEFALWMYVSRSSSVVGQGACWGRWYDPEWQKRGLPFRRRKQGTGEWYADVNRIALVVLFSDTLAAVWPIYSSDEWKVVCLLM